MIWSSLWGIKFGILNTYLLFGHTWEDFKVGKGVLIVLLIRWSKSRLHLLTTNCMIRATIHENVKCQEAFAIPEAI